MASASPNSAAKSSYNYVIIRKDCAQECRKILEKFEFYDANRKIKIQENQNNGEKVFVQLPLKQDVDKIGVRKTLETVTSEELSFVEMVHEEEEHAKTYWNEELREFCRKILNSKNVQFECQQLDRELPSSYEKHGDLILLSDSCFSNENIWSEEVEMDRIWACLCKTLKGNRVAQKSRITDDDFRSPKVKMLYNAQGKISKDNDTWVRHVDNGIVYTWDITRCMFSIGNITEKLRVARFDCRNEVVVDLFAGIGYFSLPYLVHAKAKFLHACEWNPASVEALQKTLQLNKISKDRYEIHPGDNRLMCPKNVADRVNLGLIPSAEISYKTACEALSQEKGGILHVHGNVLMAKTALPKNKEEEENKRDSKKGAGSVFRGKHFKCKHDCWEKWAFLTANQILLILQEEVSSKKWNVELTEITKIKSYAPKVDHLVVDLSCRPTEA